MMRPLSQRELAAYAAGVLDPGEAAAVAAALVVDPDSRRRLAELNLRIDAIRGEDRWHLPKVALPDRVAPLELVVTGSAMTAGRAVRAGDPFVILIHPPSAAEGWWPVVVRECGGTSEVVYPASQDEWRSLAAWPATGAARELRVVPEGAPGRHRYVVVLTPTGTQVDWSAAPDDRWAELRAAVEDGTTYAAAAELDVTGDAPGAAG